MLLLIYQNMSMHVFNITKCSPMIELLSLPKAQTHGGPLGTVNLQNDQFDEKYLGRKVAFASDDCLFNFGSSSENM